MMRVVRGLVPLHTHGSQPRMETRLHAVSDARYWGGTGSDSPPRGTRARCEPRASIPQSILRRGPYAGCLSGFIEAKRAATDITLSDRTRRLPVIDSSRAHD